MSLIEKIEQAGIVGCGGAGFPTHIKLAGSFNYVIVNGAECEPLLHTDRYLMKNHGEQLVTALEAVGEHTHAKHCVIALKKEYTEEIAALQEAIQKCKGNVSLHLLEGYYPLGDEQVLVNEVTTYVVPPGGIPKDVGAVVSNVATMIAISDAMKDIPFTHKYLTVAGAVNKPMVMCVPLGTPVLDCIATAGGATVADFCVINGGPMMGKFFSYEEAMLALVTKTTSGLIVLPNQSILAKNHAIPIEVTLKRAKTACIQCGLCTELCPRHLLGHPLQPHRIMRKMAFSADLQDILLEQEVQQAMLCSECGICEVIACPMGLQPRKVNQYIKSKLRETGFRYPKTEGQWKINPMKQYRNIPTKRVAARVGVLPYYSQKVESLEICTLNMIE